MAHAEDTLSSTLLNGQTEDENRTLCDRCTSLGLSIERFIVHPPSSSANALQQQEEWYEPKSIQSFSVKTGTAKHDFATFKDLCDNEAYCAFCRLVRGAMERYSGRVKLKINANTLCSLQWEIHGRETTISRSDNKTRSGDKTYIGNKTRRIRLSWNETTGLRQQVFFLFVAPRDPSRPNSDAKSRYQRQIQFLGREFGDQKKKQALIKSWLDLCIDEHTQDCRVTHGADSEFKALIKDTYFGVIDVADMQLKSLPLDDDGKPKPYVALSYVWGQASGSEPPYMTNRKNVMTHILHGGLETAWDKLPRTLQDAMRLVSLLNYRYIWIDSLCIVQDSYSSWQLNAEAMHLVYGHAEFTICAADGRDATSGLLAVNDILVPSSVQNSGSDGKSMPMSEDMGNGVRLMAIRPLEATINDSHWNQRAWTFQERVLSRRCVIFADGRVYFQCRAASFSQDVYANGGNNSLSLDRSSSPLGTLRELIQRPFWFYITYVRLYTGRQLTQPRDILAAYKGIDWLLCQYIGSSSIFGLPASHFDLALLWSPQTSIRHRRAKHTSKMNGQNCSQDALGNCRCHNEEKSFEGLDLPTWSWSGWMDGAVEYDTAMLEGCLHDVHEWLRRHTWIQWYARDDKGHLRSMSDIMSQYIKSRRVDIETEVEEDKRWRGYPIMSHLKVQRRQENLMKERPRRDEGLINHDLDHDYHRRFVRDVRAGNRLGSNAYYNQRDNDHRDNSYYNGFWRRRNVPYFQDDHDGTDIYHNQRNADPRDDRDVKPMRDHAGGSFHDDKRLDGADQRHKGIVGSAIQTFSKLAVSGWTIARAMVMPSEPPHFPPPPLPPSQPSHWDLPPPTPHPPRRLGRAHRRSLQSDSGSQYSISTRSERSRYSVDNKVYQQRATTKSQAHPPPRRGGDSSRQYSDSTSSDSGSEPEDEYGRIINSKDKRWSRDQPKFQGILPDNPFRVISHTASAELGEKGNGKKKRDEIIELMPVLQFFTWSAQLCVTIRDARGTGGTVESEDMGLSQCDILDGAGDWCGAIVLDKDWIRDKQGLMFYFIALSDAQKFTIKECPTWTYYIPKERDESEWDLYYVMLLQRNHERGLWERVGIGKVFQAAFCNRQWDEIKLG